jgi:hypothetical protein
MKRTRRRCSSLSSVAAIIAILAVTVLLIVAVAPSALAHKPQANQQNPAPATSTQLLLAEDFVITVEDGLACHSMLSFARIAFPPAIFSPPASWAVGTLFTGKMHD